MKAGAGCLNYSRPRKELTKNESGLLLTAVKGMVKENGPNVYSPYFCVPVTFPFNPKYK